ncbi:extracellular solute-binding protein [Halostella sp. PRR32]|uniref:extracellular solute-binding protein n=1 Tax=Halostella sp. PRR32 TaxID=3098147 RepID=UPI002B1E7A08|nr:extracellular solute-binding protein [Halostella sp. PRR32]
MNGHDGADGRTANRRRFLAGTGAAGMASLAGCSAALDLLSGDEDSGGDDEPGLIGSGREGRDAPGGTPMSEMPDLSGTLTLYSGRGEPLVGELISYIVDTYDDFEIEPRYNSSTDLVNQIRQEGEASPADVFFSVNAGALGLLADENLAATLPDDVAGKVDSVYRDDDDQWVGTSGRARTIPYNTNQFSESDIPDDIFAFPDADQFQDSMGWAPSYGSFQAFVTAMRILNGEDEARSWLEGMIDQGVEPYSDEFTVARRIADGELGAGFTNHYYIQRVVDNRDDPPIATAFTEGDAGTIFNVAGAAVVSATDQSDLAANFIRHLLSAEAQEYFAVRTFEYPLIAEVEPVGELPTIDKLNPPELDLTRLSEIGPTLDLMREAGIDV